ncbi:MAG TPA: NAD-dependent deacylase [Aggregatilineaceae bacterium]|nr:NAD-dependent deacylase [Aggregatilineaceae bacterium]
MTAFEPLSPDNLYAAARALRASRSPVVLTGAGISHESGIPTFRDALTGLWARYDPQQLATPGAFRRDPKLVWDWYEFRRELIAAAQPNPGHTAIAALERLLPGLVVITQNVDGLHHAAGSRDIIALHGDIRRNKCFADCRGNPTPVDISGLEWDGAAGPPRCPHCGAYVRPDVVWFEESLPPAALARAFRLCEQADVALVAGTSGVVYPAASLPFVAKDHGARVIEVNPTPSAITPSADWYFAGPSGEVLPRLVAAVEELGPDAG